MQKRLINPATLDIFSIGVFETKDPFPWCDFHQFLTPEGFQELYRSFPSLELFEKHEGLERGYHQRPHNRLYLAYEESIYHPKGYHGKGVIQHKQLPPIWQRLIEELQGEEYQNFVKSAFGAARFTSRYAWHVGVSDSEVSPHLDVMEKIGFHNFYFNTSEDWDIAWGGQTLVLGGLRRRIKNPDFSDFEKASAIPFLDNHSLLLKNTPQGWHGVKPLACPEGKYRRLFSVIFETPQSPVKKIMRRTLKVLLRRKKYAGEK